MECRQAFGAGQRGRRGDTHPFRGGGIGPAGSVPPLSQKITPWLPSGGGKRGVDLMRQLPFSPLW